MASDGCLRAAAVAWPVVRSGMAASLGSAGAGAAAAGVAAAPLVRPRPRNGDAVALGALMRASLGAAARPAAAAAVAAGKAMDFGRQRSPTFNAKAAAAALGSRVIERKSGVEYWGAQEATAMTMEELINVGRQDTRRRKHGIFLHRELRIRVAKQVLLLESLPLGLPQRKGVQEVIRKYTDFVARLDDCPSPESDMEDFEFTSVLEQILSEGSQVGHSLGLGVWELASELKASDTTAAQVDASLQQFFAARCGTRLLMSHHLNSAGNPDGFSGVFELDCDLSAVTRRAAEQSVNLCVAHFQMAPQIVVEGGPPSSLTCVPLHASYILTEVLKNSCRAVVERQRNLDALGCGAGVGGPEPVVCRIEHGEMTSSVTVSDRGGGMSAAQVENAWKFMHSTSGESAWARDAGRLAVGCGPSALAGSSSRSALSGYGIGLPMSRLYAQHFGGSLSLTTNEGHGTDVCLTFNKRMSEFERLPERVA